MCPEPSPWRDYLADPARDSSHRRTRDRLRQVYARQREVVRGVFAATRPKVMVCLGAGLLNDLPYGDFVRANAKLHLIDWLPGLVETGIAMSILDRDGRGDPRCLYCALGDENARAFCRQFHRTSADKSPEICDSYVPAVDDGLVCAGFERGEMPILHGEDVTGGFASAFGERIPDEIADIQTWRQALNRATSLAKRLKGEPGHLSIDDDSVDLVISSMLISQFEHEPYDYFSHQTAALLGLPSDREKRRLHPHLERLRSLLLVTQIERHCDEIARILRGDGVCYMSFELFHGVAGSKAWFLVREMHQALGILADRFDFFFDVMDEDAQISRSRAGDSDSMVLSVLLRPKRALA